MKYEKLTEKIIGCAYQVYNKMGFGFLESVYEKCLMLELNKTGLKAKAHEVKLVNYLNATQKDIGLIIDFGEKEVEIKRKFRKLPES